MDMGLSWLDEVVYWMLPPNSRYVLYPCEVSANNKAHWLALSSPGETRLSSTPWIKSRVFLFTCTHQLSLLLSGKLTQPFCLHELIVRHTLPNAEEKYLGLAGLTEYSWYQMIILAAVPCKLPGPCHAVTKLICRCPMARSVLQIHLARPWRKDRFWPTSNLIPLVRPHFHRPPQPS